VLGRLRDEVPEAVIRDVDTLALGPDQRLDLAQFLEEARRAQSIGFGDGAAAVAIARSAIARYRGRLLPHDAYEPWIEEPREAARRAMLDLLDLCAEVAVERGDLDEARQMVERTIELAPYEDDRCTSVAGLRPPENGTFCLFDRVLIGTVPRLCGVRVTPVSDDPRIASEHRHPSRSDDPRFP
jgi:hypothetical protein